MPVICSNEHIHADRDPEYIISVSENLSFEEWKDKVFYNYNTFSKKFIFIMNRRQILVNLLYVSRISIDGAATLKQSTYSIFQIK